ncbi:uncharacterized protein [Procambarus clarkii]|uniref:uncharacterized protein n=1 Tax=Procambarus clarkii TaxID=6728 RepID=UPI0037436EF7
MQPRVVLVLLTVVLAILGVNEAAVTRHNGRETLKHYPHKADFYKRLLQVSEPNPFLKQRLGMPRMQNFPQEWPYNQHQVQSLPRIGINPTRVHSFPQTRPYNSQKIQAAPSYTHMYQQKQVKNDERLSQSYEPKNQASTVKHSTTKKNIKRGIFPSTKNNYKYPVNQDIKQSIINPMAAEKVRKQWVLPRTSLWASRTSPSNTGRRSRQRVTEYKEFQSKSVAFGGNILLEGKTSFEKHKGFVNHKLLSWTE